MLHIKKTTLNDLKHLKDDAEDLRRKEYMEKFGPIKKSIDVDKLIDTEIDDFL